MVHILILKRWEVVWLRLKQRPYHTELWWGLYTHLGLVPCRTWYLQTFPLWVRMMFIAWRGKWGRGQVVWQVSGITQAHTQTHEKTWRNCKHKHDQPDISHTHRYKVSPSLTPHFHSISSTSELHVTLQPSPDSLPELLSDRATGNLAPVFILYHGRWPLFRTNRARIDTPVHRSMYGTIFNYLLWENNSNEQTDLMYNFPEFKGMKPLSLS